MAKSVNFIFRTFENSKADVYQLAEENGSVKPIKVGTIESETANEGALLKLANKKFSGKTGLTLFNIKTQSTSYKISKDDFIKYGEEVKPSSKVEETK